MAAPVCEPISHRYTYLCTRCPPLRAITLAQFIKRWEKRASEVGKELSRYFFRPFMDYFIPTSSRIGLQEQLHQQQQHWVLSTGGNEMRTRHEGDTSTHAQTPTQRDALTTTDFSWFRAHRNTRITRYQDIRGYNISKGKGGELFLRVRVWVDGWVYAAAAATGTATSVLWCISIDSLFI